MNKSINALVIIYSGKPSIKRVDVAAAIAEQLKQLGIVESLSDITITAKDSDSLSNLIVKEIYSGVTAETININAKSEDTKLLEGAIVLIGTMFAESLVIGKETGNYAPLMKDLLINIHDEAVRRALDIISGNGTQGTVSRAILTKYKFTASAVAVMKEALATYIG